LFHQLRELGTVLDADLGVTVPMRGVLETLEREGPLTVPHIARARPVSRQHIQRIVDELLANGLVRLEPNPDHKRSPLVALTDHGRAIFKTMMHREITWFAGISRHLPADEVAIARKLLDRLQAQLAAPQEMKP